MREMLARKFKMADERNEEAISDIIKGKTYSGAPLCFKIKLV
jgi:hypothetical protein